MITLTEAAVDAACLALNDGVRSSLYRDRWESLVRHALEAAVPHLTDDGVALPVRRDGEVSLAATPSSPHLENCGLRTSLVAIKADLEKRSDDGEAHLFLNIPYWQLEELLAEYPEGGAS